ncbi:MAG: cyclic-di-AMP receptor [Oscillospiraceae bacterium]|nr:cyclic-di-AMP receptor [Oscillospiraceae bacterium]
MKLIIAIINRDDANAVTRALSKSGFSSTRLSTTGGFLMAGNVTLLIGLEESKVSHALEVIREHSHSRKQMIPASTDVTPNAYAPANVEVTVGGATIFVVDVDRYEHF